MKNKIAFFDFDGTITTRDTLLEFIKFSRGTMPFYLGFILNSPWLIAYKLKLISNQTAKERILKHFFGKMPLADFEKTCGDFAQKVLPGLLRPKALTEIGTLREQNATIVIVSASPGNWIRPWADTLGLQLIATRLETSEGALTGRIYQRNCHGQEKVSRINESFRLDEYEPILAYGDTGGDKPMLALANISFYKPFR